MVNIVWAALFGGTCFGAFIMACMIVGSIEDDIYNEDEKQ